MSIKGPTNARPARSVCVPSSLTSGEALTFAFSSVSEYSILQGSLIPGAYATRSDVGYAGTALMTTYVDNGAGLSSAVPEPSTWAMMLMGFVGLGYAAFRRARKETAAIRRHVTASQIIASPDLRAR